MKMNRIASVPLILHDPYFSVWSSADSLNSTDTVHWSGARQKLRGYLHIDDAVYCFMGNPEQIQTIPQTSLDITCTSTSYTFTNDVANLKVTFTSPLLLQNPLLVSRPCTYIDCVVETKRAAKVKVTLIASSDFVATTPAPLVGNCCEYGDISYASMGKAKQTPLGHSGDNITIDWGFLYLAGKKDTIKTTYDVSNEQLVASAALSSNGGMANFVIAYDDLCSINYFGHWQRGYWNNEYSSILDAISQSIVDREETLAACLLQDSNIEKMAMEAGGEEYALLCNASYRHAISAHKLIVDENGEFVFLSKENDSNGCIGTVDVSYPSVPLFLLYNTEYVKGMLRPIFRFAKCPVWEYDFAPHDVGRYPYATGQVYGQNKAFEKIRFNHSQGSVFPFYYQYPKGSQAYELVYQMPVEECGNMLIMTAACCLQDGNADFAAPHLDTLKKWAQYLLEFGADPGEQLCTDDFAGHLSHNVNLSVKAIMGIEAFALLAKQMGMKDMYLEYHNKAQEMAKSWEERATTGNHYSLVFGNADSWSLKYNLIWDLLWDTNLFSDEVYKKEWLQYCKVTNTYGVPLDSRADYTKSDWILWCAAMAENAKERKELIIPVAKYLQESKSRVPFSDWYDTKTGLYRHFIARSVQGGIYMPVLRDKMKK